MEVRNTFVLYIADLAKQRQNDLCHQRIVSREKSGERANASCQLTQPRRRRRHTRHMRAESRATRRRSFTRSQSDENAMTKMDDRWSRLRRSMGGGWRHLSRVENAASPPPPQQQQPNAPPCVKSTACRKFVFLPLQRFLTQSRMETVKVFRKDAMRRFRGFGRVKWPDFRLPKLPTHSQPTRILHWTIKFLSETLINPVLRHSIVRDKMSGSHNPRTVSLIETSDVAAISPAAPIAIHKVT